MYYILACMHMAELLVSVFCRYKLGTNAAQNKRLACGRKFIFRVVAIFFIDVTTDDSISMMDEHYSERTRRDRC